jgi:hypothetical protein
MLFNTEYHVLMPIATWKHPRTLNISIVHFTYHTKSRLSTAGRSQQAISSALNDDTRHHALQYKISRQDNGNICKQTSRLTYQPNNTFNALDTMTTFLTKQ